MKIRIGDKYRLRPVSAKMAGECRHEPAEPMTGTVVAMNVKHGFALVDFGPFRECFSFYGPHGIYDTIRGRKHGMDFC